MTKINKKENIFGDDIAFQPKQLENYFKLRLDESSQWEIRQTAIAMQELIK